MDADVTCKLLLYADDSALLVSGKDVNIIEHQLCTQLKCLSDWLIDNKLSLHLGKTESILFGSNHKLKKCSKLNITCHNVTVASTSSVNYLGAILNQTLSGEEMGNRTIKRANSRLKFLYRKGKCLSTYARKLLVSSLIQPHFNYACTSWFSGLSKTIKNKLQITQNKLIRYILKMDARSHIDANSFIELNWLPVESRVNQMKLNIMYKIINSEAPEYLTNDFDFAGTSHNYTTRSS